MAFLLPAANLNLKQTHTGLALLTNHQTTLFLSFKNAHFKLIIARTMLWVQNSEYKQTVILLGADQP